MTVHQAETTIRGDTLLEDWPKRESMTSYFGPGEDDLVDHHHHPAVQFSEFSQLHVYERESMSSLRSMTYTKEDRKFFSRDALLEGLRIKNLIAAVPLDSAESIKYLLSQGIVGKEEFLGIEPFILGQPRRVVEMRRRHAAAVLWKQQEQQHQELEDPVFNLGEFARSSSRRSTEGARIRAGLAA